MPFWSGHRFAGLARDQLLQRPSLPLLGCHGPAATAFCRGGSSLAPSGPARDPLLRFRSLGHGFTCPRPWCLVALLSAIPSGLPLPSRTSLFAQPPTSSVRLAGQRLVIGPRLSLVFGLCSFQPSQSPDGQPMGFKALPCAAEKPASEFTLHRQLATPVPQPVIALRPWYRILPDAFASATVAARKQQPGCS